MLGVAMALAIFAGIASAQERSLLGRNDPVSSRCSQLHEYLYRYTVESPSQHQTSRRLRADVALVICDRGDTDQGVAMLEAELRAARLPEPTVTR